MIDITELHILIPVKVILALIQGHRDVRKQNTGLVFLSGEVLSFPSQTKH